MPASGCGVPLRIVNGARGWEDKLDRYGINAVVADFSGREEFIKAMERRDDWEKKYSDRVGAVFYRKKPI